MAQKVQEETDSMASAALSSTVSVNPLVSVAITTYNLERWLPRAIDSVLEQRTTFPIEIVIADDCSADATLSIAHSYRERYPNLIRVLERSKNVGVQRNTWETLEQCRGKYTAQLDGDDYWTDPEKLAIQVKTMESDSSISVCCHYVRMVTTGGEVTQRKLPSLGAGRYGLEEIIRQNIIFTNAAVFRTGIHREIPDWYFNIQSLSDWPLWILAARAGNIVLIDRVMADYRMTPDSSFLSKGSQFSCQMEAMFYEHMDTIIPSEWHRFAHAEAGKRYESVAYWVRKQGDFSASRNAALKAFCIPFFMDNIGSKTKTLFAAVLREAQWRLRGGRAVDSM
jgi:glycosyltransferase involved in cell wall biosynthesis